MALYTLPKQYHPDFRSPRTKPNGDIEIDWRNPLSRGLFRFWMLDGVTANELVNNELDLSSASQHKDFGGSSADFINAGEVVTSPALKSFDAVTIIFKAKKTGTLAFRYFWRSITPNEYTTYTSTSNFRWRSASAFSGGAHNVTHEIDTDSHIYILIYDGTQSRIIIDGVDLGTQSATGQLDLSGGNFNIGNFQGPENLQGSIQFFAVYDRALTLGEAQEINKNPYQILKPKTPPIYFTPSAVVGINIPVIMNHLRNQGIS